MKTLIEKAVLPMLAMLLSVSLQGATRPSRAFLGASASYPSIGAEIHAGLYQRIGYGYLSGSYIPDDVIVESVSETGMLVTERSDIRTTLLCAGYRLRLFSFAYHNINLYAGAGAFSGVRSEAGTPAVDGQEQSPSEKAVYGIRPDIEAEFFLGDRFALVLNGAYMHEVSADPHSGARLSAGLRLAF